jgi:streptomycin 6-kinase
MAATRSDGSPAVLKIQIPHRESEHEGAALTHWAGRGAVTLLAEDPEHHALLLEQCRPGTAVSELPADQALDVLAAVIDRLSVPAGPPFSTLESEAARWARNLEERWLAAGRPFSASLLVAAREFLDTLPGTQGSQVLVHQDLHADNVRAAQRESFLAIDPKPLIAEREFALAPVVRGGELGHGPTAVHRRLERLTSALGLDLERTRGWALVQTLAWGFAPAGFLRAHGEVAQWLLEG